MRNKAATAARWLAERAAVQHGIVTHAQLLEAGLSRATITRWTRGGRLHRVHRGVYALGHGNLGWHGRSMAAVLACGAGTVLSHTSAAALWELLRPEEGPIHVSIPTANGRERRDRLRIHRRASLARLLDPRHRPLDASGEPLPPPFVVRDGIPVTAPWLTIDDLRTAVPERLYRHALRQAELRKFVLSPTTPRDRTRSEVERQFLEVCREYGLPLPEVNVRFGRWTVDFVWFELRVVVEVDTWGTHRGSVAFEDDHQRDLDLRGHGFAIHRYTDLQLERAPARIAADLAGALGVALRR